MDNQVVLSKILQNARDNNRYSNAYLIVGHNANDYVDKIVSFITNEEHKVVQSIYQDYLKFEDDLKKEHVIQLQQYFSKKPVEKLNKKIYAIQNIENASVAALNSLLKFLEEPVSDTIAILTCKNKENVIPTIVSRTQVITLKPEQKVYSDLALQLYHKVEAVEDVELLFLLLHQEAKNYQYTHYFEVFDLLKNNFKDDMHILSVIISYQHQFEKSCNINLVLDQMLYCIKN